MVLCLLTGLTSWIIIVKLQPRLKYNYPWYISSVAEAIEDSVYIADAQIKYLSSSWRCVVHTNSSNDCSSDFFFFFFQTRWFWFLLILLFKQPHSTFYFILFRLFWRQFPAQKFFFFLPYYVPKWICTSFYTRLIAGGRFQKALQQKVTSVTPATGPRPPRCRRVLIEAALNKPDGGAAR